jgi:hypothetical protein
LNFSISLIFDFVFYERQISGDVIRNSDIRKRLTKKIDLNIPNANTDNKSKLFVTVFAFTPAPKTVL